MNLVGKKVLVTGSGGFIGSHLAERLAKLGCRVVALTHYDSRPDRSNLEFLTPETLAELDVRPGDVRDPMFMLEVTKGCQVVFHLAALIGIPYSYLAPSSYVDTNIKGTMNVLQACLAAGVERLVHTSTSECYGTAQYTPIDEAHPLCAQSPYSATKIGADHIALSYHRAFGTPVVVLRPFNTYGPRQSARAVIPTIISQLLAGERRIKLGSAHPTRDFSFVSDTVRGFARAAVASEIVGETINIGSGFEISIGDTAALIAEILNVTIAIETDEARVRPSSSEVERLFAGIGKAEKLLDWRPLFAAREGFKRGIVETIAWFSEPANLARYKHDQYNI